MTVSSNNGVIIECTELVYVGIINFIFLHTHSDCFQKADRFLIVYSHAQFCCVSAFGLYLSRIVFSYILCDHEFPTCLIPFLSTTLLAVQMYWSQWSAKD